MCVLIFGDSLYVLGRMKSKITMEPRYNARAWLQT